MVVVVAAAVPRLCRGLELDRPVGGLLLLMAFTGTLALGLALKRTQRTVRGDAVLARHRSQASASAPPRSPAERVALEGPGVEPQVALIFGRSRDFGFDASGGCGSDGGGGGCGGCGGCG